MLITTKITEPATNEINKPLPSSEAVPNTFCIKGVYINKACKSNIEPIPKKTNPLLKMPIFNIESFSDLQFIK